MPDYNLAFIDDHSLILQGLKAILHKFSFFKNTTMFVKPVELISYLHCNRIDLVVTDLTMPEKGGLQLIPELKKIQPSIKIAVFTQHDNEGHFKEAYKLGINAYILKSEHYSFIPEILIRVMNGEFYVSPEVNKFLRSTRSTIVLNELEHNITKLLIQGKSLKEISSILNFSDKVVEYRLKKLKKMFHSKTTAELVFKMKDEYFQ